jgi:amino acid transporter
MFQRKLNRIETLALSVAVIAMMVGMSLNTPFIAKTAGSAVPLVFVVSTVGVLCIALSFVRLASKVGHAGSVYGLIYYAQGRTSGFVAGWAMLLTYGVLVTTALCGFGVCASGLLDPVTKIPWTVYAAACGLLVWFMTDRDIRLSTRLMLAIEFFSIALVVILSIVIVSANPLTFAPFELHSASLSGFSQGLVFGVLTFVGFEAAASLGEEAKDPMRDIPFAIIATVLVAGGFFIFVSYAQTVGYGLNNVAKFAGAEAPFKDLAPQYTGSLMADLIQAGALVSTFAMAIGAAAAAGRLTLALARDGFLPNRLARLNQYGSPRPAGNLIMVGNFILSVAFVAWDDNASDLYGYTAAIATLTVLIVYAMMNIASLLHFTREDMTSGRWYMIIPPIIGLVLVVYAILANIYPMPDFPLNIFPYLVMTYMAIGIIALMTSKPRHKDIGGIQGDLVQILDITETP